MADLPTAVDPIRTILMTQSQLRCIDYQKSNINLLIDMLINSDIYLCSEFKNTIKPTSEIMKIGSTPHNLQRTSNSTFMYCDIVQENSNYGGAITYKTQIIERNIENYEAKVIEEFQGNYTSWGFCNDYALLINRDGDFLFYNMLNKNIYQAEKQHPGQFADTEIMHTEEHMVTCGGCVKNQITQNSERIIKVWSIDNADCLYQSARINTGHSRSIHQSFLMNKVNVVTLSEDKSIRFTNLITQEIDSIVKVPHQFLSGCQIDFNTIIAGGLCKSLHGYDKRLNRMVANMTTKIPSQLIQVVTLKRFTDNVILFANINDIYALDIRNFKVQLLGEYEGERISCFLTLNNSELIIGNKEKTLQVWRAQ